MCAGYLVGCGWWGGRRVVGVLASVLGFWLGSGSEGGVSGGWRCLVGGGWFLVGGWCGVRGGTPFRSLLNPRPIRLVCGGSWFGSSPCWMVMAVGWWGSVGRSSFLMGVGWSCGWLVLRAVFRLGCSQPGVVVAVLVGRSGSAACLLGLVPWLRALWVAFVSWGCSQACRVVPVGWADLDGRALRRPPLSPPTIHDGGSQTPVFSGRTHTLKR